MYAGEVLMAKNFKNLITVYNFNAQQAKVSGVFYYFEVKFFFFPPGREGWGVTSQTTREHMNGSWRDVGVSKV